MPTYTYKCKYCGKVFESFQSITDPPLKTCLSCSGELERVITGGSGLIFKGSGFYITDYARKKAVPAKTNGKSEKSDNKSD